MPDKGKRKRDWGANEKKKGVPGKKTVISFNNQGQVDGLGTAKDVGLFLDWLHQWAHDMHAWGQDVRDDIVRLESHAGFASGDPGDPPDGPPNDD